MKKLLRNSIFTIVCALAFLFVGVTTIQAAEDVEVLENTEITSGYKKIVEVGGEDYYLVGGSSTKATLKLKSIKNGEKSWFFGVSIPYSAKVTVAKCTSIENNVCSKWAFHQYANGDDNSTTSDIKGGKLDLTFKDFTPNDKAEDVLGLKLSTLSSEMYGLDKTYFVVVDYELDSVVTNKDYLPQVFRVVFSDDLDNMKFSKTVNENVAKITIESKIPLKSVVYFSSSTKLADGYKFAEEYEKAGNGKTLEVSTDPEVKNGVFIYKFNVTIEDGKFYYFSATDEVDNISVYDFQEDKSDNKDNEGGGGDETGTAPEDSNIAAIVLTSLFVVLVISLVLVIVQRIVDYRKKLY